MVRPIVSPSPISSSGSPREPKKVGQLGAQKVSDKPVSAKPVQTAAKAAAVQKAVTPPSPPAQRKLPPSLPPTRKVPSPPAQAGAPLPTPPAQMKPKLSPTPPQNATTQKTSSKVFSFLQPQTKPPLPPTPPKATPKTVAAVTRNLSEATQASPGIAPLIPKPKAAPSPKPAQAAPMAQPASPKTLPTAPKADAVSFHERVEGFEQAIKDHDLRSAFATLTELQPGARRTLYEIIGEKGLMPLFRELLISNAPAVMTFAFAYEAFGEDKFRNEFLPADKNISLSIASDVEHTRAIDEAIQGKTSPKTVKTSVNVTRNELHELADALYDDRDIQGIVDGLKGTESSVSALLDAIADRVPLQGTLHFIVKSEPSLDARMAIYDYAKTKPALSAFAAKLLKQIQTGKWPG